MKLFALMLIALTLSVMSTTRNYCDPFDPFCDDPIGQGCTDNPSACQ